MVLGALFGLALSVADLLFNFYLVSLGYGKAEAGLDVKGNNNQIYTAQASVTVEGDDNTVFAPEGVSVSFNGKRNVRNGLGQLTFIYTSRGLKAGCGDETQALAPDTSVGALVTELLPNPAPTGSTVRLNARAATPTSAPVLLDTEGKVMMKYAAGSRTFRLNQIPLGHYTLRYDVGATQMNLPLIIGLEGK